ncbi:MAG: malate/lactate/ureidoglycolate dehydrogenase [Alphaproteobacteria bacterium]|nr:malate/lactate/ureidoglycolate dehydrogenase [Alphaproteobacteria bacterium]
MTEPSRSAERLIPADALRRLVQRIFAAFGSAEAEAASIARNLVDANLAGHESHGVIRVASYLTWSREGKVFPNRAPRVVLDHGAAVTIDGDQGFGQVAGERALAVGIERARDHGVALVALRNSGHLGRIGGFAETAAAAGLVSLHFVNSPGQGGIQVAPFGGRDRRLAPNPLAIGVPAAGGPALVLDITTSVVPEGKVRVALNRGVPLPEGAMIDAEGRPSRDPAAYYGPPAGALLAMGGHKGSGLCIMADLLAGALTGGGCSDPEKQRFGNNMLSIVIDPASTGAGPGLADEARALADWVTSARPVAPGGEVLVPGQIEARLRAERLARGVPLDPATSQQLLDAARSVGLPDAAVAAVAAVVS